MLNHRNSRRKRRPHEVTSRELAEMGFCEKRILLAHRHGERQTPQDEKDIRRGLRIHQQYLREGLDAQQDPDRRCFIASHLYGIAAPQTIALRRYRDAVLLKSFCGRVVVRIYYDLAPTVCALLRRCPVLEAPARSLLDPVVDHCQKMLDAQGERDGLV